MMTTFAACFLAGAAMGIRYSFVVLLPAMVAVAVGLLLYGWADGQAGWSMFGLQLAACTALQLGYVFGVIVTSWPARKLFQPNAVPTRDAY